ncbi:exocyst complex subunit Sec15-like protein [Metschnikowia bicuspidata var. bicuspidata NRRL YB-4993]|uniref:Exocyst complex component SEC15 n=1 Tax=Metschnikowia bicuspidata var. bicuspidata NRRL YB-4993 TaxID=869754 RepID=A0A1A0HHL6_9ASCO|nr:exocyst complex subunit Sec15-like protein [Metschnikowia bicuspidata var. bicuspidata NRRL YB-4993]OBA23372.1 exocyst complex subunit Sec15-like protein [Metschnikowia bicuspidata var. bicuspidata NRRL YB-4993]
MAPVQSNDDKAASSSVDMSSFDTFKLENLLIRDADAFQTSLSSEDYLDSLAPIITDALKANALSDFITTLNNIVKAKDSELSEKSLNSANDINTCIDSIDQVSDQSNELRENLKHVNDFLNKSVFELINKKKALIKCRETSNKINETIAVLSICIQVLEITNKIHDWIKQHKYFSALKLIEELTSIHLPKVKDFSFSVKIYDSVPHLTAMIKDESFDTACKWLSTQIERKIEPIGDSVFANLAELNLNWEAVRADKNSTTLLPHRLNSAVELSMRDPSLNFNIFDVSELAINLAPIYDCVLVYQSLGELPSLCAAYHKEWMKKYQRIIYPITLSLNVTEKLAFYQEPTVTFNGIGALEAYLKQIAAFFTIDKQLNTKTKFELRSNDTANDLWESFAIKLKPVLLQHLERKKWGLNDLNELADYKEILGNFLQVMENSQYRVTEIHDVLMVIFKLYFGPILIQEFRVEFNESMQSDHYMPLVVTDKIDYDNVMKICWYKKDSNFAPRNFQSVPISFPFSEDYVHYCLGMRTLLQDVIDFTSKHYTTDFLELNHIIVNEIFEKVLGDQPGVGICNDIEEFIEKNLNNKEIVAQTYTNLEYYLFSLYEMGKVIDRRLRTHNGIGIINIDTNSTFKLKAIELFAKVRKFSENAIFKMVDQKVSELLDMVEYDDWFPVEKNTDPNFFILDFSLFLENLFNSIFSNLPTSFRTLGLFRSYDFISEYFLNLLNNAHLFNRTAILNFDLDVNHLEKSMAKLVSNQRPSGEEGGSVALQSTFAELRQSIDVLLLEDHEEYMKNPTFRMRRFDRLKYESAVKLIKKLKGPEENDSIYSGVDSRSGGLTRDASILSGATFAKWGKFGKGEN